MRGLQISNTPRSHRGMYHRRHQQQMFSDLYPNCSDSAEGFHHETVQGLREPMTIPGGGVELQPDESQRRKKKKAQRQDASGLPTEAPTHQTTNMANTAPGTYAGIGDPPLGGFNYSSKNQTTKMQAELEELKKGSSSAENLYDNEFDY